MTATFWEPLTPATAEHRVVAHPDDGQPIIFHWHFPRGSLSKRMSGLELATFVLPHMHYVRPYLSNIPRAVQEWDAMLMMLAMQQAGQVAEMIVPWIRSITRNSDDDVIQLSLFDKTPQPEGTRFFLLKSVDSGR